MTSTQDLSPALRKLVAAAASAGYALAEQSHQSLTLSNPSGDRGYTLSLTSKGGLSLATAHDNGVWADEFATIAGLRSDMGL